MYMMNMKLTNRDNKWLAEAVKLAKSTERVGGSRMSAILVLNNRPAAFGRNMNKSHPMQKRFGKNPEAIYQHAEINCIVNFLRTYSTDDLKKSTLYIGRVFSKADKVGLAKPCSGCAHCIEQFEIKKVVYTTTEMEIEENK